MPSTSVELQQLLTQLTGFREVLEQSAGASASDQLDRRSDISAQLTRMIEELHRNIQRRDSIESALRESERRFQLLYDNNPSMYFTLSPEGIVFSVNKYGAEQLGYQTDDLIGRSVLTVFRPDDHDIVLEQLNICTSSPGKLYEWEIQKIRQDGTMLWVKERAQAVQDRSGRMFVLVVCEDVTARRLTEDIVRESEERWRALFEHAGVGIAQLGLSGQFIRVNPRLCETLGYSSKTMLQHTFQELTHPDDLPINLQHLKELTAGTLPSFSIEKRYRRIDDTWIWVNMTVSLVRTVSGAPAYYIAVAEDVSERKRAEEALRASELLLQRFVSEALVGLVIVDHQRRLLTANKAFCEMTGYDSPELIGQSYDLYTHPDDLPAHLKLTEEFYRGLREEYTIEKRYLRKTGDTIWVSVKATGIELPSHPGPLILAVVQDITDQKRATEEREQFSQDLHDNILQSLYAVGMQLEASRLAAGKSARKSKVHVGQAIDQLNHLVGEVRHFIALLKRGTSPEMDFRGALHQLVSAFSAGGHRPPELDIKEGVLNMISPDRAEQLLNIAREALSNSVRHAKAAHRSVRLSPLGHTGVRMQICDDGIGFTPKLKRKQGHGLVNMAARAKKIGARLRLTSKPNQGTCVTVDFSTAESA
jgi:PAS domain S-box-containing protein